MELIEKENAAISKNWSVWVKHRLRSYVPLGGPFGRVQQSEWGSYLGSMVFRRLEG